MRISLNQIKAGAKCFRYLSFLSDYRLPPEDEDIQLIREVVTKAYRVSMETEWKVEWKKILGWVDSSIFKDLDITDEEVCSLAKKRIERILIFLSAWYQIYLEEQKAVYINIPLESSYTHSLIYGIAPLVQVGEQPTIIYIDRIARSVTELYNDLEIRGVQCLLAQALEVDTVEVNYLQITQEGKLRSTKMYAGKKEHERTKKTIQQVANLIELGTDYQSVTEMCSACPFKGRCKL